MFTKSIPLTFILLMLITTICIAEGDEKVKRQIFGEPANTRFNINNISTPIYGDGRLDISDRGNSGFIFPKGGNNACVYQSGFVWGGKIEGQIRTGGSVYRTGLVPGKILESGTAEDPNSPSVRVYRVRENYENGSMQSEISDGEGSEDEIREQYRNDWFEWPAIDGAPYDDLNSDGIFDPNIDKPGIPGADQTIWYVANDLDSNQTKYLYGSLPFGFEMQVTIWGYNLPAPIGNMMFRKYIVINKGNNVVEDMYFGAWSDPDNGDAGDDYVACDTVLNMGYDYNSDNYDAQYGTTPPAVGFKILQGPVVNGLSSDIANFMGNKIYGKKNLPMTAIGYIFKSHSFDNDPPQARYEGTTQLYRYLQGLHKNGTEFIVPVQFGNGATRLPYSGDPVTGEGYLLSSEFRAGDYRIMECMGPFKMMPGDTQEVIIAQIAAGVFDNCTNIGAVGLLKLYALQAEYIYNNNFDLPTQVPKPDVTGSPFDREIILTWGNDYEQIQQVEEYNKGGFRFQGYNIYQLPTYENNLDNAIRIATYDIIDGVKYILDKKVFPESGITSSYIAQYGADTGIQRFFNFEDNYFTELPLNNGTKYTFAVTAYYYNEDSDIYPNNLESDPAIISIMPESIKPGTRYEAQFGEEIDVAHHSGYSGGEINVTICDPSKTTGHEYEVRFTDNLPYANTWSIIDLDENRVLTENNSTNLEQDVHAIVDGFQITVTNVEKSFRRNQFGIYELMYNEFYSNDYVWHNRVYESPNPDQYYVSSGSGSIESVLTYFEYAAPRDFELRFTEEGGYAVYGFEDNKIAEVPFELWNIGNEWDEDDDVRMIPFMLSNDDSTKSFWGWGTGVDKTYWTDEYPSSDIIFWADPEDNSHSTAGYDKFAQHCELSGGAGAIYDFNSDTSSEGYYCNFYGGEVFPISDITICDYDKDGHWPPATTIIRFETSKPFSSEDEYRFTTPGVIIDQELAKEDVEKINVFPNPYYANNPNEIGKYQNYVMFNHLPKRAKFRIFNLAGHLVRTLEKNDDSQFYLWDLQNEHRLQAPSGLYIIYIEMPDLQKVKVLKLAIVQRGVIPQSIGY